VKAVVFRGPGELSVEEVPDPELTPDGVIIAIEACGICGSDVRRWQHGAHYEHGWQIPGHEIAGKVVEVGKDVTNYAVGDRLALAADVSCGECYYCRRGLYNLCDNWQLLGVDYPGGMAEYMQLPRAILHHGIVHRTPEGLPGEQAALAEAASSVIAAQEQISVEPGEVVIIIGDGPIGILHVQLAVARGAKPVLIGRRGGRLDIALEKGFGAWKIFDNSEVDSVEVVRELTDGIGADAAIVACAAKSAQAEAVEMVRKRGRVVLFGGLPKSDPITHLNSNTIHYNELRVIGTFSYHPSAHQTALDLISRGLIDADEIITASYPIEQAQDAFDAVLSCCELKVVLKP
jgi:L-iditol 2-dehydrogenase